MSRSNNLPARTDFTPRLFARRSRLAFLSPDITSAILDGSQPAGLSLARIPKLLPLPWIEHRRLIG